MNNDEYVVLVYSTTELKWRRFISPVDTGTIYTEPVIMTYMMAENLVAIYNLIYSSSRSVVIKV